MTRKIILKTGAILAVLFLLCAGVGAVSAATITVKNTTLDDMTGVYYSKDRFWAEQNSAVEIPYNVTATEATWLSGYTANLEITKTGGEAFNDGTLVDKLTNWKWAGHLSTNTYKLATSVQKDTTTTGNMFELTTDWQRLFNVSIPVSKLTTTGSPYTIKVSGITAATSGDLNSILTTDNVGLATVTQPADFELYVREIPVIKNITFTDYYKVDSPTSSTTVTLYAEHVNGGTAGKVPVELGIDNFDTAGYGDVVTWTSANGAIYTVNPDSDTKKANLQWVSNGNAVLTTKIDGIDTTATTVTVEYKNWNTSMLNNTDAAATYDDANKFSFATNYTRTYIVGAGEVNIPASGNWDTGVPIVEITRGSTSKTQTESWVIQDKTYSVSDGTGDYEVNNVKGDGTNFLVTKNTVNNTLKTVTINLIGYKLGDANTDAKTDIVDPAVVGIHLLRKAENTPVYVLKDDELIYADCNSAAGDGEITVADILAINKFLVGDTPW